MRSPVRLSGFGEWAPGATAPTSISSRKILGAPSAAIPLPGRGVKLTADPTLLFHPSGQVQATAGTLTPVLTYSGQPNETVAISAFGRTYVTP